MKKSNTEEFVRKAIEKHGDKNYDYSHVIFVNGLTPVKIACPVHGEFQVKPQHHLQKSYCPECGKTERKEGMNKFNKTKTLTTESWITIAKEVHGEKFNYSVTTYVDARTKLKVLCQEHGIQEMLPHHHTKGYGCGECGKVMINVTNGQGFTQNQFIERASKLGNYTFEKTTYVSKRKLVTITCSEHGDFTTTGELILKRHGCPNCFIRSKGENIIRDFLVSKNIRFYQEKKFSGCTYKHRLRFDFYLEDYNACIEFDGKQHYKEVLFFGGKKTFKELQIKDALKNNYCIQNNIPLLRIRFDNIDIEGTIRSFLDNIENI